MAIEWRGISTLIPYARNARTHSDAQIAEISGSIREFGFTNPVLIDPEGGMPSPILNPHSFRLAAHGTTRSPAMANMQYYGDNLSYLKEFERDSIDLIYLDPPFNSNARHNLLFPDPIGRATPAQTMAFKDMCGTGKRMGRRKPSQPCSVRIRPQRLW